MYAMHKNAFLGNNAAYLYNQKNPFDLPKLFTNI